MGKRSDQLELQLKEIRKELAIQHLRSFEAAKQSRRTDNWLATNRGPNADLRLALQRIIARHQDLVDSDPWASKAISVVCNNWIGDGIVGAPTGASRRFADGYREWAESTDCDFYGQHNFYGLQSMIARTVAVRGSCLVRRRIDEGLMRQGLMPLQLQVLEPDYLDASKDDGAKIRFGKEYDVVRIQVSRIGRQQPFNSRISSINPRSAMFSMSADLGRPRESHLVCLPC